MMLSDYDRGWRDGSTLITFGAAFPDGFVQAVGIAFVVWVVIHVAFVAINTMAKACEAKKP